MTIIGVIANIGTSITLIKNGQVSEMFLAMASYTLLNNSHSCKSPCYYNFKDWVKIIPTMLEHWNNTGNVISSELHSLYSVERFQLFLLFQLDFNHFVCFEYFCLLIKSKMLCHQGTSVVLNY